MKILAEKANPRFKRHFFDFRLGIVAIAGLALGLFGSRPVLQVAPAAIAKLRGESPDCPWPKVLSAYKLGLRWSKLRREYDSTLIGDRDENWRIVQVSSPKHGRFWIRRDGTSSDGKDLLSYLFAEHDLVSEANPENSVRKGDVVLDCGAHVGVFSRKALDLGAARVIAIEPDPVNVECLRRNFAKEIKAGTVTVVPKGVWNSETTLSLNIGVESSGQASFVWPTGGRKVQVQVTTIDSLVRDLGLSTVDYIKMDIEGAEREALEGASQTLRQFRPRIMLDAYHLPDDRNVLPALVRSSHTDYALHSGPCEVKDNRLIPHVIFLE